MGREVSMEQAKSHVEHSLAILDGRNKECYILMRTEKTIAEADLASAERDLIASAEHSMYKLKHYYQRNLLTK